ncbi:MAG: RNA methyltransferase [Chitinophagaceae bacterium]|nr:RNA methyltransferase [Chitinophagaceae bacterium]MCW5929442.1 RNA methyltransferase [Chitinophagaceae bacterium]
MLSKSGVKYIQSLYHKKFRDEQGLFIIEGPKVVTEFLSHAPDLIVSVYGVKNWLNNNIVLLDRFDSNVIHTVEVYELEKISALSTPNQVLAVVKKIENRPDMTAPGIMLLLDDIQDPGNLGTIIRIADWFGVTGVICSRACADLYNPKVIQSTMGSILRVPTEYTDLAEWCKTNNHFTIYATALQGENLYDCLPGDNIALLVGNESKGVREELLQLASKKITIPGKGKAESLNAAVATGIVLSHLAR